MLDTTKTAKEIIRLALSALPEANVVAIENWYRRETGDECPKTRATLRHALSALKAMGEIRPSMRYGFYSLDRPVASDALNSIWDSVLAGATAADMLRNFSNMTIVSIDVNGIYTEAEGPSLAWAYVGIRKEEVLGSHYSTFLKGTSVEDFVDHWANALRGVSATIPATWPGNDGVVRKIIHIYPLRLGGEIVGAQSIVVPLDPYPNPNFLQHDEVPAASTASITRS